VYKNSYKTYCYALLASILLFACTQPPVPVNYKGSQFYGRGDYEAPLDSTKHQTYSEDSPRYKEGYTRPVEASTVSTVGVSDLAPPSSNSAPSHQAKTPFGAPNPVQASSPKTIYEDNNGTRPLGPSFIWPVEGGKVIARFGMVGATGKPNEGINISATEGEPIWAAANGFVVYASNELKGYGNMVIIRHAGGWMTAYAHARSISVKKGDPVKQGDVIAYVGMTGGVKSPQVHFAVRNGKTPVNPETYLPSAAK
jgi:murein DD-endopeptidase MepM/ murein hydrolase activator NlpD